MKEAREISGVYFRFQNPDTDKWENRVFEDLPEEKQDEILDKYEPEAVKRMAKIMANKLYSICEQFDITAVEK
jgi:hypothetical protein